MNKEELKAKYGDERVLCVDTRHFKNIDLNNDIIDEYRKLVTLYGTYYYRYDVENDQSKKQIIPYVVLKSCEQYMFSKRLKGDPRLVGGLTIGMGGHIDYCDLEMDAVHIDFGHTVDNCIYRELMEETTIKSEDMIRYRPITCFIDESNDVSSVHACILYEMELENTDIKIKETDKLEAQWLSIDEVTDDMYESLEGWSKIAYTRLFNARVQPKQTKPIKQHKQTKQCTQEVQGE